jgi:hypothetical protein
VDSRGSPTEPTCSQLTCGVNAIYMYYLEIVYFLIYGQHIPPSSGIYFIVLPVIKDSYMEVCKLGSTLHGRIPFYC